MWVSEILRLFSGLMALGYLFFIYRRDENRCAGTNTFDQEDLP